MSAARVVHASAVISGDGDVVLDGAVVVDARGVIVDFGRASAVLPAHAGAPVERVLGAVFPGLVNAHTHIELSALRGAVPGGTGFVKWVEHMIPIRADILPEEDHASIARAVAELDDAGTVAVGEVTNSLAAVSELARKGIVGCVFHEVFGVAKEPLFAAIDAMPAKVAAAFAAWPSADLVYAPAPHTLYTMHADGVRRVLSMARALGARTTLHLAEHAAERRALEVGDGPVAEWYSEKLKVKDFPWPRLAPIAFAESLGALAEDVLLVHLTDARPAELARVAEMGAPVVFCPRSNLYIETRLPPLVAALEAGIEPALGTDSLASNASLDVLAEARALRDRFPSVPAKTLLRMCTWSGARALGRTDVGRIARGSRPGLVAIDGDPGDDPCAFVIAQVKSKRRFVARRTGLS